MPTMDMEELVMELTRCKLALWGACDWAGRPPAARADRPAPALSSSAPTPFTAPRATTTKTP
jgi:hypothetical protein